MEQQPATINSLKNSEDQADQLSSERLVAPGTGVLAVHNANAPDDSLAANILDSALEIDGAILAIDQGPQRMLVNAVLCQGGNIFVSELKELIGLQPKQIQKIVSDINDRTATSVIQLQQLLAADRKGAEVNIILSPKLFFDHEKSQGYNDLTREEAILALKALAATSDNKRQPYGLRSDQTLRQIAEEVTRTSQHAYELGVNPLEFSRMLTLGMLKDVCVVSVIEDRARKDRAA